MAKNEQPRKRSVVLMASVASMSGLLFGFDTAVAAAVGDAVNSYFGITDDLWARGLWVASVPAGAIIGALFGGWSADAIGRKKGLILDAALFLFSLTLAALTPSFAVFIIARVLMGIAVGNSAVLTPIYMAEIAPPHRRGAILFLYQTSIAVGILSSFLVGLAVNHFVDDPQHLVDWRIMLGFGAILAIAFGLAMFTMPRSPRLLIERGYTDEAEAILTSILGDADQARTSCKEIENAAKDRLSTDGASSHWKLLLPVIFLGFFLQFFQQTTGINADLYFGPEIFKRAGFGESAALWSQVALGVVFVLSTLIAMPLVDRIGRRPLLIFGLCVIVATLIFQGIMFQYIPLGEGQYHVGHNAPIAKGHAAVEGAVQVAAISPAVAWSVFASILIFIFTFGLSAGPIVWCMISEIFPMHFRGAGMAIAVTANWAMDTIVSLLFPTMKADLGMTITSFIYAGFTILAVLLAVFLLPETRGVSLEEIERNILKRKPLRWIGRGPQT